MSAKVMAWALRATDPGMEPIISILTAIEKGLLAVITTLAIAALTWAGVRYVMAAGDPAGIERAKSTARSALLGLGLALLAPVLVQIVKQIVGG